MMAGRPISTAAVVALVLGGLVSAGPSGCDRLGNSSSEAAEVKPAADEPAKPTAEAADEQAADDQATPASEDEAGLAASVRKEVEVARKREALPESVPPTVAPGEALFAKVGGVDIPLSAYKSIYDLKVKKYADRGRTIPETADRRYRRSIAQRLVYQECLRQRAQSLGVEADPAEIAARGEQQRKGIHDFAKHLERRGETEQSLRDMIIAELRERAILESAGHLEPSKAEIEADYATIKSDWDSPKERVRASHILVPLAEATGGTSAAALEAEAKAKAQRIHGLVTAPGADFAALAQEHSQGPSAAKGGDIGIFSEERMAEEFSAAAFSLEVGKISEPVKTKFGYHIILLTGRWPPGPLPLSALEDQIRDRLRQRNLHEHRRTLKTEVLDRCTVEHRFLSPDELDDPRGARKRPERPSLDGKAEAKAP